MKIHKSITINEAIEIEDKLRGTVDGCYANAVKVSKERRERIKKEFEDKKLDMPNEEKDAHSKIKSDDMKKMHLCESLFTDWIEDEEEAEVDSMYHDASEEELRKMGAFDNLNDKDLDDLNEYFDHSGNWIPDVKKPNTIKGSAFEEFCDYYMTDYNFDCRSKYVTYSEKENYIKVEYLAQGSMKEDESLYLANLVNRWMVANGFVGKQVELKAWSRSSDPCNIVEFITKRNYKVTEDNLVYCWEVLISSTDDGIQFDNFDDAFKYAETLANSIDTRRTYPGDCVLISRSHVEDDDWEEYKCLNIEPLRDSEDKDLNECASNNVLTEYKRPEGSVYKYKTKRESLFDIITQELQEGEVGYIESPNGKITQTTLPAANYLPDDVGILYGEDDTIYIRVWARTKEELQPAVEIADKYDRPYEFKEGKYVRSDKKLQLLIEVFPEDFEDGYTNPDQPAASQSKVTAVSDDEDLEEGLADKNAQLELDKIEAAGREAGRKLGINESITLTTDTLDHYQPWDDAIDTWQVIEKENKRTNFYNLLKDMYGDENGDVVVSMSEVNDLLAYEREWVLTTLNIETKEE